MNNWQKIKSQPELIPQFLMKSNVIKHLRTWFEQNNFQEVDTPLMLSIPTTEPYYDLFTTTLQLFNEAGRPAYLAPSPELQMKKLLAAGLKNIYQISKCFRNQEGRSPTHQSEFTMLEFYRADAQYEQLMTDVSDILRFLAQQLTDQSQTLSYQGCTYDLRRTERISVSQAMQRYAGLNEDQWLDLDEQVSLQKITQVAHQKGYQLEGDETWEQLFNQILLNEIEPHLGCDCPTILYAYPAQQAALARLCPEDQRFAQRFEWWLAGLELGNAYGELTDATEQENRIQAEIETCRQLGKTEISDYDHDFITAVGQMPTDCAGIAIGIDRLAMLLADVSDISQITFFPTSELFPPQT